MLRTVADPIQLAAELRAAVQAEDPEQPVLDLRTLSNALSRMALSGFASPRAASA